MASLGTTGLHERQAALRQTIAVLSEILADTEAQIAALAADKPLLAVEMRTEVEPAPQFEPVAGLVVETHADPAPLSADAPEPPPAPAALAEAAAMVGLSEKEQKEVTQGFAAAAADVAETIKTGAREACGVSVHVSSVNSMLGDARRRLADAGYRPPLQPKKSAPKAPSKPAPDRPVLPGRPEPTPRAADKRPTSRRVSAEEQHLIEERLAQAGPTRPADGRPTVDDVMNELRRADYIVVPLGADYKRFLIDGRQSVDRTDLVIKANKLRLKAGRPAWTSGDVRWERPA